MLNEEQIRKKILFAGEKQPSMKRRKQDHDYRSRRMYMITMNTEGRRPLFGHVVGDVRQPFGAPGAPHIEPSALGEAVFQNWMQMLKMTPEFQGILFQLMPDHFHAILFVTEELSIHMGRKLNSFKIGCRRSFRELCPSLYEEEAQLQHPDAFRQDKRHGILFEVNYNDKILIHAGQLEAWKHYLADNPRRLLVKRDHPEFFRVRRSLTWKGMTFSALGNLFLLRNPVLLPVQCSRSLTGEEIERRKREALKACQQGAVLVSPSISPGEKAIMRAAFESGFPEIILKDNGFAPLTKPSGAGFDACARGQLLFLGPTFHSNEHKTISRSECLNLNEIAKRLAK